MTSSALHGDEDGRRIDEDRRHGDEVSGPSKIATNLFPYGLPVRIQIFDSPKVKVYRNV